MNRQTIPLTRVHALWLSQMGYPEIPPSLRERLERVEGLLQFAGGTLSSRQITAVVVEQWERDNGVPHA